jgi:hypothetical protein
MFEWYKCDVWTFNEVVANWAMEDLESGIKFCKWAIGKYFQTYIGLLRIFTYSPFTKLDPRF